MKSLTFGDGKGRGDVSVLTTDLKALLFWASVGVSKSRGGSYEEDIENIIESYLDYLGMRTSDVLGRRAEFLTEEQFYAKKFGSDGGKARALSLSKKEKSDHAKRMVRAREAKKLCTCASFFTVRGTHKKDCPKSVPPKKTPLQSKKNI